MTKLLHRLALAFAFGVATCSYLDAQILQLAEDDFGTCSATRDNSNGTVTLTTDQVRTGTKAFKHNVTPPPSGTLKRAELDCGGFAAYDPEKTFWYGFSMYLPASDFPATLGEQFLNQLRFSNLRVNPYSAPNCRMNKVCGATDFYGGSGHELLFQKGQLNFYLRHQEPGCGDCEALDQVKFNLGTAPLDQWVDFVYEGQWTGQRDGTFRIWMQVNGGGYQLLVDYRGRSWVENHTAGSQLADPTNNANQFAPRVAAPNYTVGLYYNDDNANRTMYTDHVTMYQQEPGVDGFKKVSVGAIGPAVACATLDQVCNDNNARTTDDRFDASCVCRGVPIGPELSPATMSFGVAAATQPLSIISNTAWTLSDDANWLTVSLASGSGDATATVSVTENTTGVDRSATITVDDGFDPVVTTVTQSATTCGPTAWAAPANFASQNGTFEVRFDLRVLGTLVRDAVVGVSHRPNPGDFDDNAILFRLNNDGLFDARDGGSYRKNVNVPTASNTTYSILLEVNGPARTYDLTVTPASGTPVKVADDYAFRSSWNGQLPLSTMSTVVLGSGCLEVLNLSLTQLSTCTAAGTACNDNNPCTVNDVFDANCNCKGTTADADGDGICDAQDPCDNRTVGTACNDNNPNTVNDVVGPNCGPCAGTLTCASSTKLEVFPSADAELVQEFPNTNYDNGSIAGRIRLEKPSGNKAKDGLWKWDLASLPLPQGATVTNAAIVYEFFNFNGNVPIDFTLRRSPATWTETSVTWASAPAAGATLSTRTALPRDTPWETNVTTEVLAAIAAGESFSTRLTITGPELGQPNSFLAFAQFDVKNGTRVRYRPRLVLCYDTQSCTVGTACDDGNACTTNDRLNASCNCVGDALPDADGDGICDAQDPCDNRTVGTACDDNNPNTVNDVVGANCGPCAGTLTCDASTKLQLFPSADAELVEASPTTNFDQGSIANLDRIRVQESSGTSDLHGLFKWEFGTLPAGATVTNAALVYEYFNFNGGPAMDLSVLSNPANWDETTVTWANAPAAGATLSTRAAQPKDTPWETNVTTEVLAAIAAGEAFSTRVVATGPVLGQSNNFVAFAQFDLRGGPRERYRPRLVLCYELQACTVGASCDDNDVCTIGDVFDANCNCAGTVADADGDGVCDAQDPCDNRTAGTACDDNDATTVNDVLDANCNCAGTPTGFNYSCSGTDVELVFDPVADAEVDQTHLKPIII